MSCENNNIEIMPLMAIELPRDYFNNKGQLISVKNYLLKMQRRINRISGIHPDLLGEYEGDSKTSE